MPHFAPGAVHEYLRAKWVYGVQGSRKYMGDLTCFICSVLSNNFYDRPRKHQANVRKILDRDHNLQGNTVLQPEHGYRYLTFYFLPRRLMGRNLILYSYCADPHCGKKRVRKTHKGLQSCA